MIGEAIVGGVTAVVLACFWLAGRVVARLPDEPMDPREERRRTLMAQREHWASVLKNSNWTPDREAAIDSLKRIDEDLLVDDRLPPQRGR